MPITKPYRDIPMKMKQEMKRYARKVKGKLTTVFDPDHLEALARQTDFIQRSSSKLSGKDFVELMTTEMIEDPAVSLEGLCDVLVDLNPQAQMTPQALHQRLNPYAVTYLQEVFQWALRQQLEPVCERLPLGALSSFGRVLLEDSTQCRCTRSGCQNIKLAIASYDGVPCRNGHTSSLTLRHLGTDTPRSTGLYS